MEDLNRIREKIADKGLKVTPQRIAILDAVIRLANHPTADEIVQFVHTSNPNISVATVYNVLETLVTNQVIKRVTTDRDVMRYDAIMEIHHHLFYTDSGRIADYMDEDLNQIIKNYFQSKKIENFEIEEFKLQIFGKSI